MKTTAKIVLTAVFGFFSLFVIAENPGYITNNDVDKKTEEGSTNVGAAIVSPMASNNALNTFTIEDEFFIDDIPFNTEEVIKELYSNEIMEFYQLERLFYMDDEGYIDDIPFSTTEIAKSTITR